MRVLTVIAVVCAALACSTAAAAEPSRFTLANGCYRLVGRDGVTMPFAGHVRLQATALGRYLLYRPDRSFVAAQPDGSLGADAAPSPAADWRVGAFRNRFASLTAEANAARREVRFLPATGCAVFPEAHLDAVGRPSPAAVPYGRVGGLVDGHMHWLTFEDFGGNFHCGRPWHPYGIRVALPDCAAIEGADGTQAVFQNFLNYGGPFVAHDPRGYPQLTAWSASNLTYEGTYWRWVERAWLGGLRLMVMTITENRVLCRLQRNRNRAQTCDEMDTVRRSLADIRALQRYVDAQSGGPGRGFFRIVTTPYEARRVISAGKLAVVLEIELSEPFGCRSRGRTQCDAATVDRGLDELHARGVRSALLVNKYDNPLSGVRFDPGPRGLLVNLGNWLSAGHFWRSGPCAGPLQDRATEAVAPVTDAGFAALLGAAGLPRPVRFPRSRSAADCNRRGLTPLGVHTVEQMMDRHMIINPDHMSQAAVDATLTLLEQRGYSGVISPHGWMDPGNWPRLWKLGGLAFPGHADAAEYRWEWSELRPLATPFFFGWGYGADLGGLSRQPAADAPPPASFYPFKSPDGKVTFTAERTGARTFDYPTEGVAQYGLYADWFADLRRLDRALAADLYHGAEAYLEMWERADGVRSPGCAPARRAFDPRGIGRLRLGSTWIAQLRGAGQPQQRGRAWSWCVAGASNRRAADVAVFDGGGRVALVASTALGRSAGEIAVGRPAAGAPGLRVVPHVGGAWVYAVEDGRVAAVATAAPALAGDRRALAVAMRRALAARATQARPRFVPHAPRATGATVSGPPADVPALLCSLAGV